jgi:hypothetical protein
VKEGAFGFLDSKRFEASTETFGLAHDVVPPLPFTLCDEGGRLA